jgi:hypothetical protein
MQKIGLTVFGLSAILALGGPARAKENLLFDLVCTEKVAAGDLHYGGTGASPGYDDAATHRYRIAIDLSRKLFSYNPSPKIYNSGDRIAVIDRHGLTLMNGNGQMDVWDRRSGRHYIAYRAYDGTVVIYAGICTVGKFTPFDRLTQ